jgi:septation ring formation regulator EzrA
VQSLHAELLQTRNRLRRAKNDWSALREEVVQRQQNVPQPDSLFDVLARIKRTERKLDDLTERFARAYMITGQSIESLQAAHKKATDIRSQLPRIKNEQEREDVKRILDVLFSQIHDDLQNTCSSAVTFIVLSSMDEVSTSQIEQLRHQLTHTP